MIKCKKERLKRRCDDLEMASFCKVCGSVAQFERSKPKHEKELADLKALVESLRKELLVANADKAAATTNMHGAIKERDLYYAQVISLEATIARLEVRGVNCIL